MCALSAGGVPEPGELIAGYWPAAASKVTFSDVLMSGDGKTVKLGKDLSGFTVTGTLVKTEKGDKVTVFKKRRRNTYRRKIGHRQTESHIKITAIGGKE